MPLAGDQQDCCSIKYVKRVMIKTPEKSKIVFNNMTGDIGYEIAANK
jgi:hypothetical protein